MPVALRAVFRRPFANAVAAFVCASALAESSAAQESKSAAIAKELSHAMDVAKLDDIAAADPSTPGGFIAAIYIPGSQLLVVSAKYSVPTLLMDKINAGDFRGIYLDLHSAGVPGTKVFVQDLGADGLSWRPPADQGADSFDEHDKSISFDGDWKKAKMTEADYMKAYTAADDRYARMLAALLARTKELKGKAVDVVK
jgi:hypothetical protein